MEQLWSADQFSVNNYTNVFLVWFMGFVSVNYSTFKSSESVDETCKDLCSSWTATRLLFELPDCWRENIRISAILPSGVGAAAHALVHCIQFQASHNKR